MDKITFRKKGQQQINKENEAPKKRQEVSSIPSKGGQQRSQQQNADKKTLAMIRKANLAWDKVLKEPRHEHSPKKKINTKRTRSINAPVGWGETQVQEFGCVLDAEFRFDRCGGPYLMMDWESASPPVEVKIEEFGRPRYPSEEYSKMLPKHRAEIFMQNNPGDPHPFVFWFGYKRYNAPLPGLAYENLSDLKVVESARVSRKHRGKYSFLLTGYCGQMVEVAEDWGWEHVQGLRSIDLAYCKKKEIVFRGSRLVESSKSWQPDKGKKQNKWVSEDYCMHMLEKYPTSFQLSSLAYEDLTDPGIIESVVLDKYKDEIWKEDVVDGISTWYTEVPEKPPMLAKLRAHDGRFVMVNETWEAIKLKWMDTNHCREHKSQIPGFTLGKINIEGKENLQPVSLAAAKRTKNFLSGLYYHGEKNGNYPDLTGRDLSDRNSIAKAHLINYEGHKLVEVTFQDNFSVVVANRWANQYLNCWINQEHYRQTNAPLEGVAFLPDFNAVAWSRMKYFESGGDVLCKMLTRRGPLSQWVVVDKKYTEDNWSYRGKFIEDLRNSLQTGKAVNVDLGCKGTSSLPTSTSAQPEHSLTGSPLTNGESLGSSNTMQFSEVCVQNDKADCIRVAFYLMCAFAERRHPQRWPGLEALGKEVFDSWKEDDNEGEMLEKISRKASQYGYSFLTGKPTNKSKPLSGKFDILDPNAAAHGYPFICTHVSTHMQHTGMEQAHVVAHYDQYVLDGKDFSEPVRCTQASLDASDRGIFNSIGRYWYLEHFQGKSVWFNGKFEPPPSIKRNHNEITSAGGDFLGRIKAPKKRSNDNINGGGSNLLDAIEPLSKRSRYSRPPPPRAPSCWQPTGGNYDRRRYQQRDGMQGRTH